MPSRNPIWTLDDHTRGKHLVLRAYLEAWFPILGSWSGRILFVDGFAGPGEYANGEPGSPIIALRTFLDHRALELVRAEATFLFVEKDPARAAHLQALIDSQRASLPPNCRVVIRTGSFDAVMTETLDALQERNEHLAPAFVMVDPFGVRDVPLSTLKRILSNPKSEVYVSFMYEWINRFLASAEFESNLDDLFGCSHWRDAIRIEESSERRAFLYNLYEDQLRAAGAEQVVRFELYEGNRLVYAIFFGTSNTKGSDLMKQAIWKIAPEGDFVFRGDRSGQITLNLAQPDFAPLVKAVREQFAGRGWVTIDEVEDFVRSDRTDYHSGQLRANVLIPLENAGEIVVDPASRKKRRTYPAGTRLRLP